MFKKLKRKFILTNLLTSTVVLAVAFSSIYFIAANTSKHRDMMPYSPENTTEQPVSQQAEPPAKPTANEQTDETIRFNNFLDERIHAERNDSLSALLISLLVTGVAVEIAVLFISFFFAEKAIQPVREAYEAQKEFIANASHEIKTPLAVIQANLEAADIKDNKWLDNVAKKAEDLAELNNQLLALARSESVTDEIKLKEVNLNKIIDNIISAFDPKAEEKGIILTKSSSIKNTDHIKLNKQALEQILNIYTDNGIKYGKNCVGFNIKKDRISVVSDGKPMDETKVPHLFDRFYQTDKTAEGVGLGLAIAKSIASKNGWELSAYVDKESKTNVFVLKFK
ncbi:HAMP domain-containing histidine kinase [Candidatus Saccharibacteria bacterium]|nr:HAMP domain-containing histidine kinase [Candidatus Saccharibacteria bacterium]